jgi:predicted transcriptional regulator
MTSKKRRRYGDLAARPLPTDDPALVDEVFAAFTRRPPSPDNLGGAKKPSPDKIAAPKLDAPKIPSPDIGQSLARTVGSLPDLVSLPNLSIHPLIEQAERLTYRKGHARHNHDFWDSIISQLPGNEQNVYSWLYRFREGNSNITIILSLLTLAARCGVDEKTVGRAIKRLADKGFVRDHSNHFGKGRAQGKRFWVYVPTALLAEQSSLDKMGSLPKTSPIISKELKENIKRESAPLDYKNCPDCQGSGFFYPDGVEKGVAKCKHERMGK